MAKGALITDDVREVIADVFLENKSAPSKVIQPEVSRRLNGNGTWPSLSVVEKELVKIRARYLESQSSTVALDSPWHLGLLDKRVSPEAIPFIFAVQSYSEKKFNEPISQRHAIWISHFSSFYKLPMSESETFDLFRISRYYSMRELTSEIAGVPFNTTELDNALRKGTIFDMMKADVMGMVDNKDSLYSQARDRRDKFLFTPEQNLDKQKIKENEFDEAVTQRLIELYAEYLDKNPEATPDDFIEHLQKGGELK